MKSVDLSVLSHSQVLTPTQKLRRFMSTHQLRGYVEKVIHTLLSQHRDELLPEIRLSHSEVQRITGCCHTQAQTMSKRLIGVGILVPLPTPRNTTRRFRLLRPWLLASEVLETVPVSLPVEEKKPVPQTIPVLRETIPVSVPQTIPVTGTRTSLQFSKSSSLQKGTKADETRRMKLPRLWAHLQAMKDPVKRSISEEKLAGLLKQHPGEEERIEKIFRFIQREGMNDLHGRAVGNVVGLIASEFKTYGRVLEEIEEIEERRKVEREVQAIKRLDFENDALYCSPRENEAARQAVELMKKSIPGLALRLEMKRQAHFGGASL